MDFSVCGRRRGRHTRALLQQVLWAEVVGECRRARRHDPSPHPRGGSLRDHHHRQNRPEGSALGCGARSRRAVSRRRGERRGHPYQPRKDSRALPHTTSTSNFVRSASLTGLLHAHRLTHSFSTTCSTRRSSGPCSGQLGAIGRVVESGAAGEADPSGDGAGEGRTSEHRGTLERRALPSGARWVSWRLVGPGSAESSSGNSVA